jgi:hypothetical protein
MICTGHHDDRMKRYGIEGARIRTGEKTTMRKPFTKHGLINVDNIKKKLSPVAACEMGLRRQG